MKLTKWPSQFNANSSTTDSKLSAKELAVVAFVNPVESDSIKEKINLIKSNVDRGYDGSKNDDYLSGLYKNNGNYSIAYNHSTSQYTEYRIKGDRLDVISSGGGVQNKVTSYSIKDLNKQYAPYKSDLDELISMLEENKKNLNKVNDKINKQAIEEAQNEDDDD